MEFFADLTSLRVGILFCNNSRLHGGVRNVREEVRARIELAQGFIFLGHQQKRGQPSQNGIIILMSSRYLEDYFNMALDAR